MKYYWGTIYLVRPGWHGDEEDIDEATVEVFEPARFMLYVAVELWRLAGDDQRADAIEALLDRVYERQPRWMTDVEIDDLLRLLDGIEAALVGTVVDPETWHVRPDQLPELRRRTRYLDFDESRGELAVAGVGEGIGHVDSLRNILLEARRRSLWVSFD